LCGHWFPGACKVNIWHGIGTSYGRLEECIKIDGGDEARSTRVEGLLDKVACRVCADRSVVS
jgi:hypothetical protein